MVNPLGKLRPTFNNTIKGFLSADILFIFFLLDAGKVEQSLYAMLLIVLLGFISIFINYDKIIEKLLDYYQFYQSIMAPKSMTENEIDKVLKKIPEVEKKW